jgi:hypothetical protein
MNNRMRRRRVMRIYMWQRQRLQVSSFIPVQNEDSWIIRWSSDHDGYNYSIEC